MELATGENGNGNDWSCASGSACAPESPLSVAAVDADSSAGTPSGISADSSDMHVETVADHERPTSSKRGSKCVH